MERKAHGLKIVNDYIRKTNKDTFLTVQFMVEWLQRHEIVEMIFQGPEQLYEKAKEIMMFLGRYLGLREKDIQVMWTAAMRDRSVDNQTNVFKLLASISCYVTVEQKLYVAQR
jgi:hypothetical protein